MPSRCGHRPKIHHLQGLRIPYSAANRQARKPPFPRWRCPAGGRKLLRPCGGRCRRLVGRKTPFSDDFSVVSCALCRRPHRLAAQDSALSRRQQGFEPPWGRHIKRRLACRKLFLFAPVSWICLVTDRVRQAGVNFRAASPGKFRQAGTPSSASSNRKRRFSRDLPAAPRPAWLVRHASPTPAQSRGGAGEVNPQRLPSPQHRAKYDHQDFE